MTIGKASAEDRGVAPGERDRLVRRNTILLAFAQGFVQTSFPVMLVIGGPASARLTGREGAAGLLWGLYFLAAAGGAALIGRWMDRVGRRPGLILSYALVGGAAAAAALSIRAGSFLGLLASTIPFGVALGGANLGRGAVADMYPAERRGRAVGILLAAGTIGAVGSPLLAALIEEAAGEGSLLPWIVPIAGSVAAIGCVLSVRPDPRDLAVVEPSVTGTGARTPRELLRVPMFRTAVLAGAVGQMAMVGVMGVTPTALDHAHHGGTTISLVISSHIAGMFAFAPLIGRWMDRAGRRAALVAGCLTSIVGALLAASEANALVIGAGLVAIGLGWSATFLGATAVISDITAPNERAGALGFTDLLISLTSAAAGLGGGIVLEAAGYGPLGVGLAVLVAAALLLVARLREPTTVGS
ncbi:MAG: major facilitator superfamily 1 [Actinomycetia bacterium]|nr:major facilitator superfamily 1 [Actinomycetes bacterium]